VLFRSKESTDCSSRKDAMQEFKMEQLNAICENRALEQAMGM
jgi:hypothetical protein